MCPATAYSRPSIHVCWMRSEQMRGRNGERLVGQTGSCWTGLISGWTLPSRAQTPDGGRAPGETMGGEVTGVPEVENEPRPGNWFGHCGSLPRAERLGWRVCLCPQDPYQNQGQDGGPATVGPQGGVCWYHMAPTASEPLQLLLSCCSLHLALPHVLAADG